MLGYSSHFSVRMEEAFTKCWTKGCVLFVVVGCHCHSLFFWDQMHPTLFKALWMHDANQKTWPIDRDDGYEEDLLVPEQPPSKKQRIHVYMYIYIYIYVYTWYFVILFVCKLLSHPWHLFFWTRLERMSGCFCVPWHCWSWEVVAPYKHL